jgi:hypothetical protein
MKTLAERINARPPRPPEAYFTLRQRASDRAVWAHSLCLEGDLYKVPPRNARASELSLKLFARLSNKPLTGPFKVDVDEYGNTYNWHDDIVWLSDDGGILIAEDCVGGMPGDGVALVAHVLPDVHRRILFDIGTDYIQNSVTIVLSADDPSTCESLIPIVDAVFQAEGLPPLTPTSLPRHLRPQGPSWRNG